MRVPTAQHPRAMRAAARSAHACGEARHPREARTARSACTLRPSMEIGTEWLVEAAGCRADALRDPLLLDALFARIIAELELKPLHAPAWHIFPDPGGITGFVMLSESHLAIHTYPEHGIATINLYCCRARPDWPWPARLTDILGATDVRVRTVDRSMVLHETYR